MSDIDAYRVFREKSGTIVQVEMRPRKAALTLIERICCTIAIAAWVWRKA